MDPQRFDALARSLVAATPRRRVLRLLTGATLGVVFGARNRERAAAACVPIGDTCAGGKTCCGGAACKGGRCRCGPGQTACDGRCRDLDSNHDNCGKCGRRCAKGETCCDGACRDLDTSPANCGTCGRACPAGHACCDGVCRDTRDDAFNCGRCGNACNASFFPFKACCLSICVENCALTNRVLDPETCQCVCPTTDCDGTCCPEGQVCCDLGPGLGRTCKVTYGGSCTSDGQCCGQYGLICRGGICCGQTGATCNDTIPCCSGICRPGSIFVARSCT